MLILISLECQEPQPQIILKVNITYLLFITGHDIKKNAHGIRKESDTAEHDYYRNNHLSLTNGIQITIPYCWEHC